MGNACHVCGESNSLNRECNYCGQTVCKNHRLPENHQCVSRSDLKNPHTRQSDQDSRNWFRPILVILVVSLLAGVALVGAFGSDTIPTDTDLSPIPEQPTEDPATQRASSTTTPTSMMTVPEIDREDLEQEIHELVNDRREANGLSSLETDSYLKEIARYHSEDMAKSGYFAHDSPAGESMSDRYDRFGYDCRVEVSGNEYLTGAENIFKISIDYQLSEEEIGEMAVESWMESPGHRENILRPEWNAEGIGVYAIDEGSEVSVYVTQNFC